MNLRIKDITLENFKGTKNQTYTFDGNNTIVSGQNASGKTTLATAWFYLMGNCDYALKNNPAIFPLDSEECKPTVTANLEVDGRPLKISKMQTRKVSKPDANGISKVSYSNTFAINDVPKSARDFESDLAEMHIFLENIVTLSHPDVFMSEKRDEQRKVLFDMAHDYTDFEIASTIPDAVDVAKLLTTYKMEEITAMQKATLRKINEDYGKEGEILNAKIEGLESAKVDIDVAELELQKSELKFQIDSIDIQLLGSDKAMELYDSMHNDLMHLKFSQGDLVRNATALHEEKKRAKMVEINAVKTEIRIAQDKRNGLESKVSDCERRLEMLGVQLESTREEYKKAINLTMPSDAKVCSFCGQDLPSDKVAELVAQFKERKEKEIARLTDKGSSINNQIKDIKFEIDFANDELKSMNIDGLVARVDKLVAEYDAIDDIKVSVEDSPEYIELSKQIAECESDISKLSDSNATRNEILRHKADLENQIKSIDIEISKMSLNDGIDKQIASMRAKQMEYEQSRADAEKILYQADLVSKRKNELLTESINKHFKIVKFKFFDYLKNGNYVECCDVFVDGKKLGESMNTALTLRAKLDICNGLGNFYKQHFPIWLDNAEALDSFNKASVESDSQVIMLCVSEDKEVTVR